MKRLIKQGTLFQLIWFSQPIIVNHINLKSDNQLGGVLLRYKITDIKYISFFNHDYAILPKLKWSKQLTFFKPMKKDWDRTVYRITPRYWGKKHHLLTQLWLEVDNDFKDIFSVTPAKLKKVPQCKDQDLIKKLNIRKEVFILSNIKTDKNERR